MLRGLVFFALFSFLSGVAAAQDEPRPAAQKPNAVYVCDFMLPESSITEARTGPVRSLFRQVRDDLDDPEESTPDVVNNLSEQLVEELGKRGFTALRSDSYGDAPGNGWLVEGEFLEYDEGDNLRRATIGLGSGASKMRLKVTVTDLSNPQDGPFLVFDPSASSGKAPGGAPAAIIAKNPYVIAGKLVLSRNSSPKETKKLAAQIAQELYNYVQAGK